MMASNILSHFFPPGAHSVYETIKAHDDDLDENGDYTVDHALDEENLETPFHDDEVGALATSDTHEVEDIQSTPFLKKSEKKDKGKRPARQWAPPSVEAEPEAAEEREEDDDVPASLLIEDDRDKGGFGFSVHRLPPPPSHVIDIPDEPAQPPPDIRQRHTIRQSGPTIPPSLFPRGPLQHRGWTDPREVAMWRWTNVENLDNFLKDVYGYYLGHGMWCIILSRALNLLTFAFVIGFTTFLFNCIDYRSIPHNKKLTDVMIPQCSTKMPGWFSFLLWLFSLFWVLQVIRYAVDLTRLRHMHDFYFYLLGISDQDIQTISWPEIVQRLMNLRDSNPATAPTVSKKHRRFIGSQSKQRMDAQDIANRLMRKENYLIALFNKDILNLTLPLPFMKQRQFFSRTLEWNINLCLIDFVFNEQGQVRPIFLTDKYRKELGEALRRRFMVVGWINIVVAPFLVVYFLVHTFFRYFNEYQKNPSQIGSRQYTRLAEWKFREFNELWHLFQRRLKMSYPFASRYIDQFPKDMTVQLSRFVAFVAGALAGVLALVSVVDPELFLGFELSNDRTVLFYLGVFGSIWAVARGMVPEESLVFDPEYALGEVVAFTHYMPAQWTGRLHSEEVKRDFATLYQMRVVVVLEEALSMVCTPFMLWFSLPQCADRLIDFFREFTIHVDGLGHICSFAEFGFQKGDNTVSQRPRPTGGNGNVGDVDNRGRPSRTDDPRRDYYSTKDNKMLTSYFGFLDNYGGNPRSPAPAPGQRGRPVIPPPPLSRAPGPGQRQVHANNNNNTSNAHIINERTRQARSHGYSHDRHERRSLEEDDAGPTPFHSILLDPHHQPSIAMLRQSPLQHTPARGHRSRPFQEQLLPSTLRAHERERERGRERASGGTGILGEGLDTSKMTAANGVDADGIYADIATDGNKKSFAAAHSHSQSNSHSQAQPGDSATSTSDSWRFNLAGVTETDEEAADGVQNAAEQVRDVVHGGAGVLGLLQQFQRASNERAEHAGLGV